MLILEWELGQTRMDSSTPHSLYNLLETSLKIHYTRN